MFCGQQLQAHCLRRRKLTFFCVLIGGACKDLRGSDVKTVLRQPKPKADILPYLLYLPHSKLFQQALIRCPPKKEMAIAWKACLKPYQISIRHQMPEQVREDLHLIAFATASLSCCHSRIVTLYNQRLYSDRVVEEEHLSDLLQSISSSVLLLLPAGHLCL
jgi:hypothetical protein